jgi:hypothetical protein
MTAYSPLDREGIWTALFALLQSKLSTGYTTMSRTHVQPPALNYELQPALFLVQARETKVRKPAGLPKKTTLSGFIILYYQAPVPLLENIGAETINGATQLNAMLLAIDTALEPDNLGTGKLTLGGLVEDCYIEGDTDMDTGIYSNQAAAIVPLRILLP